MYDTIAKHKNSPTRGFSADIINHAETKIKRWWNLLCSKSKFLTGANISVITDDFMKAVDNDEDWALRFPIRRLY